MENNTWQLQEAKAKLSEVVKVSSKAPQCITLHGQEAAYVVSPEIFHRYEEMNSDMPGKAKKYKTFGDFLENSPLKYLCLSDEEVDELFARNRSTPARGTDEPLFD